MAGFCYFSFYLSFIKNNLDKDYYTLCGFDITKGPEADINLVLNSDSFYILDSTLKKSVLHK